MNSVSLALGGVIAMASASIFAPSEKPTLGGFICVAPPAPACADTVPRPAANARIAACERELEAFATSTIAYRECLTEQIGAAMLRVNGALDRFRCRTKNEACDRVSKTP
jgi:hypothetical protein